MAAPVHGCSGIAKAQQQPEITRSRVDVFTHSMPPEGLSREDHGARPEKDPILSPLLPPSRLRSSRCLVLFRSVLTPRPEAVC